MTDWKLEAEALAKQQFPREACGIVVIFKGREKFIPCDNISQDNDSFVLSPEDFAKAEDLGEIVAIWHSHCGKTAQPSEPDLVSCEQHPYEWHIYATPLDSWYSFKPSGYKAPLIGREFRHGVLDCYTLVRDYYEQELKILLPDFAREDFWWNHGKNLYMDNYPNLGFVPVKFPEKVGDLILMSISADVANHAGIYIGNSQMLHHLYGRLSSRDMYGGMYQKHTVEVIRLCQKPE